MFRKMNENQQLDAFSSLRTNYPGLSDDTYSYLIQNTIVVQNAE